MKKSFRNLAITGLLIGGLAIGGATSMALANGNAYQNYKTAAMQTLQSQNMTLNAQVSLQQDGQTLVEGTTFMQVQDNQHYSQSQLNVNGETQIMESAINNQTAVFHQNGQYSSFELNNVRAHKQLDPNSSTVKLMEMVVNTLVGDVKTHFTSDGNHISLTLDGAQVPELLNVAASAVVEQYANQMQNPSKARNFHGDFPNIAITQNVQIKEIHLDADLENGYLKNNVVQVSLTGTDGNGVTHEMELFCNTEVSDIGSTIPQTLDTTGKDVQQITKERFHH